MKNDTIDRQLPPIILNMKKIMVFTAAAFLFSGMAFAHGDDKNKAKAKKTSAKTCGKQCGKKREESKS